MDVKSVALLLKRTPNSYPVAEWLQSADCDVRLYHADDVDSGLTQTRQYERWKTNSSVEFDIVRDHSARPFDAIVALSECDQVRAAELRQYLDVPGQQPASALACRDKLIMKNLAVTAAVPVPRFMRFGSVSELIDIVDEFGSVVVKPVDGAGSLGVVVLGSRSAALAWAEDQERLSDDPANYLAEEYIDAPMLSVDGISQGGEIVFSHVGRYTTTCLDSVTRGLPHGILSTDPQDGKAEMARRLASRVIAALPPAPDLRSFHIELFDHPTRGMLLCEIACRTGGGLLSEITQTMYGVHLEKAACLGQAGVWSGLDVRRLLQRHEPNGNIFGDILVPRPGGETHFSPGSSRPRELVTFRLHEHNMSSDRARKVSEYLADGLLEATSHEGLVTGFEEASKWFAEGFASTKQGAWTSIPDKGRLPSYHGMG